MKKILFFILLSTTVFGQKKEISLNEAVLNKAENLHRIVLLIFNGFREVLLIPIAVKIGLSYTNQMLHLKRKWN
jgi:hypothetical protein